MNTNAMQNTKYYVVHPYYGAQSTNFQPVKFERGSDKSHGGAIRSCWFGEALQIPALAPISHPLLPRRPKTSLGPANSK